MSEKSPTIESISSIPTDIIGSFKSPQSSTTSSSFWFPQFSWFSWIFIILILAFFGFNIFNFLAKGTDQTNQLLKFFGLRTLEVVRQTANVSEEGAKSLIETAHKVVTQPIDALEQSSHQGQSIQRQQIKPKPDSLQHALSSEETYVQNRGSNTDDVMASESHSSLFVTGNNGGFCFIGVDENGQRKCIQNGANDACLSSQIYPTADLCVNPRLK